MEETFVGDRPLSHDTFETPINHELNSLAALGLCVVWVFVVGSPATWLSWFPKHEGAFEIYKKQGEYGEFEKRGYLTRFPFQEPLNAITSMAYSFFGVIILTG